MIKLYIANLGKYNEGELVGKWIDLPYSEEQLNELFVEIKLGYINADGDYVHGFEEDGSYYEEYAIHDFEKDIDGIEIGEYDTLNELNELAEKLEDLSDSEIALLESIVEYQGGDIANYVEDLDNYNLHSDIKDDYDLGHYWIEESGCYEIPSFLQGYIDYEKFGQDIRFEADGCHTSNGWIERC